MAEKKYYGALGAYGRDPTPANKRKAMAAVKKACGDDADCRREGMQVIAEKGKKKASLGERGDLGDKIPALAFERGWDKLQGTMPKLAKTIDQFSKFESKIIKFGAQTAIQATNISKKLTSLQRSNQHLGISSADVFGAMQSALSGYAKISTRSWAQDNIAITKQIAVFEKLGISHGTTIATMNTFGAVLGRNRDEVTNFAGVLNRFAQETGQSYNRVWTDFNSNVGKFMDILSTEEMSRQTLLFSVRARRMGVDVGSVMSNLERFETLDSAQAAAGKINAVMSSLGGSFDAIKAASLDYPERMNYIANSIQSVMGRVEASGPRASRAYMKAMKSAFGLDSKTFRALISYKPGQALPAEIAMGQGLIGGLSTAATSRVAAEAATIEERTLSMADARESFAYHVIPTSMGLAVDNIVMALKTRSGELDTTLIKMSEATSEAIGAEFTTALTGMIETMGIEQGWDAIHASIRKLERQAKCPIGTSC